MEEEQNYSRRTPQAQFSIIDAKVLRRVNSGAGALARQWSSIAKEIW